MTETTAHGALLAAASQYLEMMYDGDLNRFDAVFAPTAQLHGVQDGQVRVLCPNHNCRWIVIPANGRISWRREEVVRGDGWPRRSCSKDTIPISSRSRW
jgi:hypothetical protein